MIQELLDNLDIQEFLDIEGVEYRTTQGTSGLQFNICTCPWCGDNRFKVYMNAETALGNCFAGSCPKGTFNSWQFIQEMLNLNGRDTFNYIKNLAESIGWMPKKESNAREEEKLDLALPDCLKLPINGKNLKYLNMRGIDLDVARYFDLRFAMRSWFKYLAGGEERYQLYERRIIFPIYDENGNLASFQGRDITNTAESKYLFPPGYASTGSLLYNLFNVSTDTEIVVLCEGVFDVMAAKIAIDTNVDWRDIVPIGSFGMSLSPRQIELLSEHSVHGSLRTVVIAWDGTLVAAKKALKAGLKLIKKGINVRIAFLPKDRDPNEITPGEFCRAYRAARTLKRLQYPTLLRRANKLYGD